MAGPLDPTAVLDPDGRYLVAFDRPIGLPGRIARQGVQVAATGAEIEPYRDFVVRIEEAEA